MHRTVERKYELTTAEIKEAILHWLRHEDVPAPPESDDCEFRITEDGAVLTWTDQDEIKVSF